MTKMALFRHYMLAGHGRALDLIEDNDAFRSIVLYGCLNNTAYDIQCEGSRGLYMYNIALQFSDCEYFLDRAADKFLSADVNDDFGTISHLCDFLENFAADNHSSAARVIKQKYDELYSLLMTKKHSKKMISIAESFEYIALVTVQNSDFEQAIKVFEDIGAYFIRRQKISEDELKWFFPWFYSAVKEKFGKEFLHEQLELNSKYSKEIRRFNRVMSSLDSEFKRKEYPKPTAEEFIEKSMNSAVTRRDILMLRKAGQSDKIRIANAFLSESDPNLKAGLLSAFTSRYTPFPLDTTTIIECAKSENEKLRSTAVYAMKFIKNDCVHNFAAKMLKENFSVDMLEILIHNYRDSDNDFILKFLEKLTFDLENESGWHGIISEILNTAESNQISKELLIFAYENSLCSYCRENIFDELSKRNWLTDKMVKECLWDCNEDIRKKAKKLFEAKQI